jgi:presenilin-like A22 family membrane protease
MAGFGIFGAEWFNQIVLPFALVFTLIFAILEKSKILGEEKHQINSIISLVTAFILIAVPLARGVIIQVIPVIAVLAVLILVFMLILGFVGGTTKEGNLNKGLGIAIGILTGIVLIAAVLWSTGWLARIIQFGKMPQANIFWQSLIFIIIIVVVMIVALKTKTETKEE